MLGRVRAGGFAAIVTPGVRGRPDGMRRRASLLPTHPPRPPSIPAPTRVGVVGSRHRRARVPRPAATGWKSRSGSGRASRRHPRFRSVHTVGSVRNRCARATGRGVGRRSRPRGHTRRRRRGATLDEPDAARLAGRSSDSRRRSDAHPRPGLPGLNPVPPPSNRLPNGASCRPVTVPTVIRIHLLPTSARSVATRSNRRADGGDRPAGARTARARRRRGVGDRPRHRARARPDAAVAGMPAGSRLIAVGSAATVSRTHAVVRADGWTVTGTDCGSRAERRC